MLRRPGDQAFPASADGCLGALGYYSPADALPAVCSSVHGPVAAKALGTAAADGTQEQGQPAAAHHVGTVPLGQRHPTPGTGRYGLPAWVVVPDDLQLPIRTGQLPGWSPAATVIDFHLPDQLRRAIPRAHLNAWITVFEQQERTALAALEQATADGILAAVTICDGSCGNVDLVGVLFNLRLTS